MWDFGGFFVVGPDTDTQEKKLQTYIHNEHRCKISEQHFSKLNPTICKRAQSFAERLRLGISVLQGEAQDAESDVVVAGTPRPWSGM
jgi:hypothetical protein